MTCERGLRRRGASAGRLRPTAGGVPAALRTIACVSGADREVMARYGYAVAGTRFCCERPLPELAPFAVKARSASVSVAPAGRPEREHWQDKVRVNGWIAGARRRVAVSSAPGRFWVRVAGVGSYVVTDDAITVLGGRCPFRADAIFGPCFILALALRETFVLHASFVRRGGCNVAFVGDSGAGKSTLARFAAVEQASARLGDDLLPVEAQGARIVARPRYPQPKLAVDQQVIDPANDTSPVDAVVVLRPSAEATTALNRLSITDGVKVLIRHTVAIKLFSQPLHEAQLGFAHGVALRTPIYELVYAHDLDRLPAVMELIGRTVGHDRAA